MWCKSLCLNYICLDNCESCTYVILYTMKQTTVQKFGTGEIFKVSNFWSLLSSPKPHLFDKNTVKTVKLWNIITIIINIIIK